MNIWEQGSSVKSKGCCSFWLKNVSCSSARDFHDGLLWTPPSHWREEQTGSHKFCMHTLIAKSSSKASLISLWILQQTMSKIPATLPTGFCYPMWSLRNVKILFFKNSILIHRYSLKLKTKTRKYINKTTISVVLSFEIFPANNEDTK